METWYVMTDGSFGDPRDIATGKDGKLVHSDGRKVAYADHGPRSRSIDAVAERAKATKPVTPPKPAAKPDPEPEPVSKVEAAASAPAEPVKPAKQGRRYKTRESKAD